MSRLKRLGILFFARLLAVIMACYGLVAGLLYALGGFIYDLTTVGLNAGTALAFLAIPGMPVIFALCGFVVGLLGALFYNLAASRLGGLQADLELQDRSTENPGKGPGHPDR